MRQTKPIDVTLMRECFEYKPKEGALIWKERPDGHFVNSTVAQQWRSKWAGTRAGSSRVCRRGGKTLIAVEVNRVAYLVSRVIWAVHYGVDPGGKVIDHINGNSADNRLENLRLVSHATNCKNKRLHSNNSSGYTGIYLTDNGRPYKVLFQANGTSHYLGRFDCIEDALAARDAAWKQHGFHPNHGTDRPL